MKRVRVSVPGKIHLMGEHAVVYGKPALLSAIDRRLSVTIEECGSEKHTVDMLSIESSESDDFVRNSVEFLLDAMHITQHVPIKISIDSRIPAGFHLGSSAAVAVALSGSLLYFFKKLWNPMKINELAYEIEKKKHITPSGGDNTAVTVGGFIWYRKELEFLKSIWQLPFKPHATVNHFFLIQTGKPAESTGEMVAIVRGHVQKNPEKMQKLFDLNETQVKRVTVALKEGNEPELMDAIRIGEQTLEGMGVVSDTVLPLIRDIESADGSVKILGGGGRKAGVGYLLCYHHRPEDIEKICAPYGYGIEDVCLGEDGVRLDEK